MIYFRAEASATHGFGHLKRCLMIASALTESGAQATFLCPEADTDLHDTIKQAGHKIHAIPSGLSYAEEVNHYPNDCYHLVTDIYHQGNIQNPEPLHDYINSATRRKIKIAFIDGIFHEAFRPPENIPALYAVIQPYLNAENDTAPNAKHWIKGVQYAVMDNAYKNQPLKNIKNAANNILITFGGADPQELTASLMTALAEQPKDIHIRLIIGPYFSQTHKDKISALSIQYPTRFDVKGAQTDMIPHYQWADIALGSSGLSRYEFAALGLPAIFTALYPEHTESSEAFAQSGIARYIGLYTETDAQDWLDALRNLRTNKTAREEMSLTGQKKINGKGAILLAKKLLEIFDEKRN